MRELSRRTFLTAAASLTAAAASPGGAAAWRASRREPTGGPREAREPAVRSRLILLGTASGPRPRTARAAAAQVIVRGDTAYVIDCGDGVARQLVAAGVPLTALRHVFLTHHHSDHVADYGNLIWLAWASGLRTRVDAWGPPPIEKMTRLFFEMNAPDIELRVAHEGRPPLAPLVRVHELREPGVILRDEQVTVTATLVDHAPVVPAFGYRIDAADRSIVVSGDTRPSDRLIALARGADVLVHCALYAPALDRLVPPGPAAAARKAETIAHWTTAEEAGRVARAAGVKMLVLSHLLPSDDPAVTDKMWIDAARVHFGGPVVVGKDLLEV